MAAALMIALIVALTVALLLHLAKAGAVMRDRMSVAKQALDGEDFYNEVSVHGGLLIENRFVVFHDGSGAQNFGGDWVETQPNQAQFALLLMRSAGCLQRKGCIDFLTASCPGFSVYRPVDQAEFLDGSALVFNFGNNFWMERR
jgi:hypothetical protein